MSELILEKLKFWIQNGRIHFFNIGDSNFLYNRETNFTYKISSEIYSNLNDYSQLDSKTYQSIRSLFYQFKRDVKPKISFYTLAVLENLRSLNHVARIKKNSFVYNHTELIFYESNNSFNHIPLDELQLIFKGADNKDLVLISIKNISSLNEVQNHNQNSTFVKKLYNVSLPNDKESEHISLVNRQMRFEYSQKIEPFLLKLINNTTSVNLFVKNKEEVAAFSQFLMSLLNNSELHKKIYNFTAIVNFIIASLHFQRTIEQFNDGKFTKADNITCNKCWAKNICWTSKSYDFFNIDLFNIKNYSEECRSIQRLIEKIIFNLRSLEDNKIKVKEVFEFEDEEIRLIN
ncbi:MAG: hypothetical protein JST10_12795 [Bacteroidetes bacterium]|nr:hypothetical protein [Bacteroidota bacterium]